TLTEISGKTGNITLVAKWTVNYYNLSFDTAGSADMFGTKQIAYGSLVPDLPVPGKDGYVFAGWKATSPDGKSIDAGTEWLYTEDITAVAVWQAGSGYSVSYDFAGGRFDGDKPTYVLDGNTAKLSAVIPVKDKYAFAGWQIRGGTGTVTELKNLRDNVVLEAVWTKEYYTVIFTDTPFNPIWLDEKVVLPDEYKSPIKVAYGGSLINRIPNGVPYNYADYEFDNWETYINGKKIVITDRTVFDDNTFVGLEGTEIIIYPKLGKYIGPY
ncbi:MAG: InlB B-repeat-containing protein, partial [Candidatus Borkfalkiaceae bacterium]|nr:InlB B-repeat-containing protein [Christensenellaceae bacterium]